MHLLVKTMIIVVQVVIVNMAVAQSQKDSVVHLDDVEILGAPIAKYAAGSSIRKLSSSTGGGLDMIGSESAIYFKQYGSGQLATITLRGTSSSHTNVLWNGMPVNSPTLGQTDFSVWPSFLTNSVAIQKGSGSSLFGSGAIGGSIILDNSKIEKDSLLTIYNAAGSFGHWDVGVGSQYKVGKKLVGETRAIRGYIKNNFPYEVGGETLRQTHASVERIGVSQKVSGTLGKHNLFSEIAYARNDRQIQPTRTSASRDNLLSQDLRAVVSDEIFFRDKSVYASVGILNSGTEFNGNTPTISLQLSGFLTYETPIGKRLDTRSGIQVMLTNSNSENYESSQKGKQLHLFSSFNYQASSRIRFTLNFREAFHEANQVFVPSVGSEWLVLDGETKWLMKAQLSKGYRIPTFNDRFWVPGGNPELLPEKSSSYEIGWLLEGSSLAVDFSAFMSRVEDWIQWQPENGVWTPNNIRNVKSRGLEIYAELGLWKNATSGSIVTNYEYVRSSDEGVAERNQLPYVPEHSGYSSIKVDFSKSTLNVISNYIGLRYSTLSNSPQSEIEAFLLWDLRYDQNLEFVPIRASFSINNITNTRYENLKNIAMPGRNYLIALTFKL